MKTWGSFGSAPGQFFPPDQSTDAIEVDGLGHVYVTDYSGNRVVKFTTNGDFVANLGANGGDGTAGRGPGEFYRPSDLVTDAAGNLYVNDSPQFLPSLSAPQLQKFAPDGAVLARRSGISIPYGLTPGPGDRWYSLQGRRADLDAHRAGSGDRAHDPARRIPGAPRGPARHQGVHQPVLLRHRLRERAGLDRAQRDPRDRGLRP